MDGMRPDHIMEGNLLYPKSTDLNINFICNLPMKKHPEEHLTKYLATLT